MVCSSHGAHTDRGRLAPLAGLAADPSTRRTGRGRQMGRTARVVAGVRQLSRSNPANHRASRRLSGNRPCGRRCTRIVGNSRGTARGRPRPGFARTTGTGREAARRQQRQSAAPGRRGIAFRRYIDPALGTRTTVEGISTSVSFATNFKCRRIGVYASASGFVLRAVRVGICAGGIDVGIGSGSRPQRCTKGLVVSTRPSAASERLGPRVVCPERAWIGSRRATSRSQCANATWICPGSGRI